jgi:hypothetical protein
VAGQCGPEGGAAVTRRATERSRAGGLPPAAQAAGAAMSAVPVEGPPTRGPGDAAPSPPIGVDDLPNQFLGRPDRAAQYLADWYRTLRPADRAREPSTGGA